MSRRRRASKNSSRAIPRMMVDTATWRLPTCTLGKIQDAVIEVRKSLEIYPKNSLQRHNYAMYLDLRPAISLRH